MKWISLVVLVVQNTTLVLVLKYSRTLQGPIYDSSSAIVCAEIIKLIVSGICQLVVSRNSDTKLASQVFTADMYFIAVPAILYFIQNMLVYLAISCLDAASFQVTYQLKILTTAIFAVIILKKRLSKMQWLALILLTAGVAISNFSPSTNNNNNDDDASLKLMGLVAVFSSCITSGLASVWFEKVLKSSQPTVYVRNIQLSIFTLLPAIVYVGILNRSVIENGFFYGYSGVVWAMILLQALGGLTVAMVVKYADNILKGFATAISIVLSAVLSFELFSTRPTLNSCIGTVLVIAGI